MGYDRYSFYNAFHRPLFAYYSGIVTRWGRHLLRADNFNTNMGHPRKKPRNRNGKRYYNPRPHRGLAMI